MSTDTATFALAAVTPHGWAETAAVDPLALLSDHAHCELKAAASAMTLLKRNPRRPGLALRLVPLIREEHEHLQRVLRELDGRGSQLDYDLPNPYAAGLQAAARSSSREGHAYLDTLLVSALIEKRSHERFECLERCPALAELRPLYAALREAEARHGELFTRLALEAHDEAEVRARFEQLAGMEAGLLAELDPGPRVHSGWRGLAG